MTRISLFMLLLAAAALYAFWRGDRESRLAATVCLGAVVLTQLLIQPVSHRFASVESGVVVVDLATFISFTAIAFASTRFWPLWIAGLQLTTLIGHLLKAIDWSLMPRAYAAATVFWSYPILLILVIGAWRADRRRRASDYPTA